MDAENRRFKRYTFPIDQRISMTLRLAHGRGLVEARVLNISAGGLGLVLERVDIEYLKKDSEFQLESVGGGGDFIFLKGKTVRVKWVLDYNPLNNIGIGCEFINLDDDGYKEIKKFLKVM